MHEAILRQDPELELVMPDAAWTRRETAERVRGGRRRGRRGELREIESGLAADVAISTRCATRESEPAELGSGHRPGLPVQGPRDVRGRRRRLLLRARAARRRDRRAARGRRLLGSSARPAAASRRCLRAGLLPALSATACCRQRALAQSADAARRAPACASWRARSTGSADARMVLAVDQFEETFTQRGDEERDASSTRSSTPRSATRAGDVGARPARRLLRAPAPRIRVSRGDSARTRCSSAPMQRQELARRSRGPHGGPASTSSPSS